ncbi:ankyrin repeat domain-containing protein [Marinobacter halodurans]|uniref:Ankyrin repeat domain-containing protein n=2 Tax=Marinobacter halodurans TaxID=2528979 RepID=A0ABY1ZGM6_9GAMM|nr:ankyrin repeat domain-containing protein [Marinobacter halodurans]
MSTVVRSCTMPRRRGGVDIVRELLDSGLNPNAQDDNGWTPLHFASQSCQAKVATVLVSAGANPNLVDSHGNGPLWVATMNARGNDNVVVLLLENGAVADHRNKHGRSPLDMATTIGHGLDLVFQQAGSRDA